MLFVFGDIHGCIDTLHEIFSPLSRLGWLLRKAKKTKLIFLGDNIDHGPSSKMVVDFLMDLPHEKVFLMGNHEDMLLMYNKGSPLFERYGNVWCTSSNGGMKTVYSFHPECELPRLISMDSGKENASKKFIRNDGVFHLEEKYQRFFESLVYVHEETLVNRYGREEKYLFSHATPNPAIPLERVFAAKDFESFHALETEFDVDPERSNIWYRRFLREPLEDYILVHGHTPSHAVADYYPYKIDADEEKMKRLKKGFPYILVGKDREWMQVNLDCGAVYNKGFAVLVLLNHPEEFENDSLSVEHQSIYWLDLSEGFRGNEAYSLNTSAVTVGIGEHPD